jgi:hypothetical protein
MLGDETNTMPQRDLLKEVEWFVFLPSLFEARVRSRLGEVLGPDYVVKKRASSKPLKYFPKHKAEPDIVVYCAGQEDAEPIAIYDVKLYKNSKASKTHTHQVESQIAAFFDDPQNCHFGLIYGHFDGDLPTPENHVYHIDLRGDKGRTEDFDAALKNLSVVPEPEVSMQ